MSNTTAVGSSVPGVDALHSGDDAATPAGEGVSGGSGGCELRADSVASGVADGGTTLTSVTAGLSSGAVPPTPPTDTTVHLTTSVLDVTACADLVTVDATGATALFVGTTRDNFAGKAVTRLEYEAYEPMALKEMAAIADAARTKWTLARIAIVHRLGVVPVREASVVIAVSSAHRREALEALQFLIDTLKARVPIWKKEWYADETGAWKENAEAKARPSAVESAK